MKFDIYQSDVLEKASNTIYKNHIEVTDETSLKRAVSKDFVCALYKDYHRSNDDYISANMVPMDIDNDHSEDENDWISADDISAIFPGVSYAIHYSRNNMKEKNGKKARPKFHVFFVLDNAITNWEEMKSLKEAIWRYLPQFDSKALDSARFYFGTASAKVEIHEGKEDIKTFIDNLAKFENLDNDSISHFEIKEGSRNGTMSQIAARLIKRYGDTEEAFNKYLKTSEACIPPLEMSELKTIWHSAQKFFKNKVAASTDYIAPEDFKGSGFKYIPNDLTDVGQAECLANLYRGVLRYSPQTKFIVYRNNYWQESDPGALGIAQDLTSKQLDEAAKAVEAAEKKLADAGLLDIATSTKKKDKEDVSEDGEKLIKAYMFAKSYHAYALKRRDNKAINASLSQTHSFLEIDARLLDSNEFLLCTPKATYDLRYGMLGAREHKADDFITKMTAVSPSNKGMDLWLDAIKTIFQGNQELIDYVQLTCGLAAIGKIFNEGMIIAYGDGANGKSTFWNTIGRVLGNYQGKMSPDTLIVNCKRNVKPEMAELRGKRLIICSESQEGARLNDSMVKQLCATDDILGEKKYKDPLFFTPTHMLVLYTNHLPKVSGMDDGTWRRLIVIPFNAKITGKKDIKNYSDYLYQNAGEAVLAWIIEGAKKVIELDYRLPVPEIVSNAITAYKEQNNWFQQFLDERCIIDPKVKESSSALYLNYKRYTQDMNEYTRSTTDFYASLDKAGFKRRIAKRKRYYVGLKLKECDGDFEEVED